jgi:uncharacterized repeat protein (TIGR02543 family)
MKKHITDFIFCLMILIVGSCEFISEDQKKPETEQESNDGKTRVSFVNKNDITVSIYSDSTRTIKIADVGAWYDGQYDEQVPVEVEPNSNGALFYPTYHLNLYGISMPYEGEVIIVRIDPGEINLVTIPSLKELGAKELTKPLISGVAYLGIQNYGNTSFILMRGNSDMRPEGKNSSILRSGETGLYIISPPGPAVNYKIARDITEPLVFPAGLTEFSDGRFYLLRFDGSKFILVENMQLTLAKILGLSIYSVTFNINGGSGTTPAVQTVNSGSSLTLPNGNGLSRSGYTFGGWNTNSSGTGTNYNAGSSYTVTGNVTLYAKWNTVYTVTFSINGGIGTTPVAQTVNSGSNISLPNGSGLSRSGYTFGGWNTNSSGTGTNYYAGSSYTVTGDVTLYAKWYNCTVTFNPNGGSGPIPADQMVISGSSISLPSGSGLSRNRYTFDGWNTDFSGTGTNYNAGSSYTVTSDVEFYAKWIDTIYTVSFNLNGGSGTTPSSQTAIYGATIKLPDVSGFSRSGYSFGGWYTNASGTGTKYYANGTYYVSGNVTLYVKWDTI